MMPVRLRRIWQDNLSLQRLFRHNRERGVMRQGKVLWRGLKESVDTL